jgi:hypothetical protein
MVRAWANEMGSAEGGVGVVGSVEGSEVAVEGRSMGGGGVWPGVGRVVALGSGDVGVGR